MRLALLLIVFWTIPAWAGWQEATVVGVPDDFTYAPGRLSEEMPFDHPWTDGDWGTEDLAAFFISYNHPWTIQEYPPDRWLTIDISHILPRDDIIAVDLGGMWSANKTKRTRREAACGFSLNVKAVSAFFPVRDSHSHIRKIRYNDESKGGLRQELQVTVPIEDGMFDLRWHHVGRNSMCQGFIMLQVEKYYR